MAAGTTGDPAGSPVHPAGSPVHPAGSPGVDDRVLCLGTRGSALALVQSRAVAAALREAGVRVELVVIRTAGDDQAPDTAWGEGAFVGALERALLDGSVDLAVHSSKDVPTTQDPRLAIAAFVRREDPRDALVCRERGATLDTLPPGARVGTDSPRRTAFLLARRPDLRPHPLNGNVDTRLRRLDAGESDALVLAVAGLTRLGRADRIDQVIDPDIIPPAPGQGAVAVQVRADDVVARALVARLDHAPTRAAVEAERAFLHATGGGCRAPIGALALVEGDELILRAGVSHEPIDASNIVVTWGEERGPVGDRLAVATRLAVRLAPARRGDAPGAARKGETPGAARRGDAPGAARRPRVLVTRARDQARPLADALEARGIEAVVVPTIALEPVEQGGPLDAAARRIGDYAWVVVTSANGADALLDAIARVGTDPRAARWAAVGSATETVLRARGVDVGLVPSRSSGEGIADELTVAADDRILLARADIADGRLPERLRAAGAVVDDVIAYRTIEAPATSRGPLAAAFAAGPIDALAFTSGSCVRGLLALLPAGLAPAARSIPAVCIGSSTADAARTAGFLRVVSSPMQRADALADAIASVVEATSAADLSRLDPAPAPARPGASR